MIYDAGSSPHKDHVYTEPVKFTMNGENTSVMISHRIYSLAIFN